MGLFASFSMGSLSDRLGRANVILAMAGTSMVCSFLFGWSINWPIALMVAIGIVYAFSALGDSPVFSAALTEVVEPSYLGAALGLRSLVGFGAAALAPLAFGAVLDWTNHPVGGQRDYSTWGWAFVVLGLGGLGAVWATYRYGRMGGSARQP
jgi:MFS family permease